jgi:hypothetical protein
VKKTFVVLILFTAIGIAAQVFLYQKRPFSRPDFSGSAIALMGGFRSLAAEVVWFRADRLQEEGRFVELAQLASTLTFLEPHTSEVWSFAAWNLAYNISVMMPTYEDRWHWVESGLKLLRDEGLKMNPHDAELYRELAWMFQIKLGSDIDSAAAVYRKKWAEIVKEVSENGQWHKLRMEKAAMDEIEKYTSFNDWTNPLLSAVYWARKGLPYANGSTRTFLIEIIRQSLFAMKKQSRQK